MPSVPLSSPIEAMAEDRHLAGVPTSVPPVPRIDIFKPRYDQTTFVGRAQHFFETANPLNVFVSSRKLAEAAKVVTMYR